MTYRSSLLVLASSLITTAAAQAQGRPAAPVQLPDGAGKDLVETDCARCHGLNQIVSSGGYTADGWQRLIASMVALPDKRARAVGAYLGEHFPPKPGPQAVLVPGPVTVSIREWLLPTLGSRPHDPLATTDGAIWWTGQWSNVLGRLDPATGAMKEYPLETPESGPHGLVADRAGNIWYTGVSKRHVGRLDPATGDITEYPLPEGARGPHTPIFDPRGTLWFTLQSGMVGRLVPETGEMKVVATPTTNSYPYGIVVNSKGVPWYVDFRGNRVGSLDPVTMEIREYSLPNEASRPRRIAITPDDAVWYTDYPRGYIGRFDPRTGEVREWPSPGGPSSRPYGIAAIGAVLWYSESGVRPNTLVRFDTETERFQTWVIPSGGGVVRHMMATADGKLVLACSGVNRVALVEIGGSP